MQEIWKDIEDYKGIYQVSDLGNIRKIDGYIIKPWITRGYCYVGLSKKGNLKKYRVHRLVAEAFIPNPNNLPIINHKDENKINNCVNNLEWCTQYENVHKYFDTKPEKYNKSKKLTKKIKNYHVPRKILQLDKNGTILNTWNSMMDIERNLGIRSGNISLCCRGIKPTAKGYIWKYADK